MFDTTSDLPYWLRLNSVNTVTTRICAFFSRISSRVVLFAAIIVLPFSKLALAEMISCPEALRIVEESATGFSKIRSEAESEFGGSKSTLEIPGSQYCVINEYTTKDSYRCTWKYPYRDALAASEFDKLARQFSSCLGDRVERREDQPVNHPDSYESYLFALPAAEARITLKDKRELNSTFVSFVVEAIRKPK